MNTFLSYSTGVLYYAHLPLILYSSVYYEHLSLLLYWCVYYAHLPLILYSSVCSVFYYEHTICCTMSALFPPCKLYGWNPSPPLYWYVVCIERLTLLLWKVEHLPPYFTSAERLPFIYYSVMLSVLPPHLASRCLDK